MADKITPEKYEAYKAKINSSFQGERRAAALQALDKRYKASNRTIAGTIGSAINSVNKSIEKRNERLFRSLEYNKPLSEKLAGVGMYGLETAGDIGMTLGAGSLATNAVRKGAVTLAQKKLLPALGTIALDTAKSGGRLAAGFGSAIGTSKAVDAALPEDMGENMRNLIRTGVGAATGIATNGILNKVPIFKAPTQKPYVSSDPTNKGRPIFNKIATELEAFTKPGGKFRVQNPEAYQEYMDAKAMESQIRDDITGKLNNLDRTVNTLAKNYGIKAKEIKTYDKDINDYLEGSIKQEKLPMFLRDSEEFKAAARAYKDANRKYSLMDTDFKMEIPALMKDPAWADLPSGKKRLERIRFLVLNRHRLKNPKPGEPFDPAKDPLAVSPSERLALDSTFKFMDMDPEANRLMVEAFRDPKVAQRGHISSRNFVREYMPRRTNAYEESEMFVRSPEKDKAAIEALMKKGYSREYAVGTLEKMMGNRVNVENQVNVRGRKFNDDFTEDMALREALDPITDWRYLGTSGADALAKRLGETRLSQGLARTKAVVNLDQITRQGAAGKPLSEILKGADGRGHVLWREGRSTNASSQMNEVLSRQLGNKPSPTQAPLPGGASYVTPEAAQFFGSQVKGGLVNPMRGAKGAEIPLTQGARAWNDNARTALVGMNPLGAIRNALGDFMNMFGSGFRLTNAPKAIKWARNMRKNGASDELGKAAEAAGIGGGGFLNKSMLPNDRPMTYANLRKRGNTVGAALAKKFRSGFLGNKLNPLRNMPEKLQGYETDRRLALFKDLADRAKFTGDGGFDAGTDIGRANIAMLRKLRDQVNSVLFDYANPSSMSRTLNTVSPISSYTANAYINMPEQMIQNPGRYGAILELLGGADRAADQLGLGIDASRIVPMGGLVQAGQEKAKGMPMSEAMAQGLGNDFTNWGLNSVVRAFNAGNDRDDFGRPITKAGEGMTAGVARRLAYFARPYVPNMLWTLNPTTVGGYSGKTANVLTGATDAKGNRKTTASQYLLGLTGLPVVRDDTMTAERDLTNAKRRGAAMRELLKRKALLEVYKRRGNQ